MNQYINHQVSNFEREVIRKMNPTKIIVVSGKDGSVTEHTLLGKPLEEAMGEAILELPQK
jgi:hypothetical protein